MYMYRLKYDFDRDQVVWQLGRLGIEDWEIVRVHGNLLRDDGEKVYCAVIFESKESYTAFKLANK